MILVKNLKLLQANNSTVTKKCIHCNKYYFVMESRITLSSLAPTTKKKKNTNIITIHTFFFVRLILMLCIIIVIILVVVFINISISTKLQSEMLKNGNKCVP